MVWSDAVFVVILSLVVYVCNGVGSREGLTQKYVGNI